MVVFCAPFQDVMEPALGQPRFEAQLGVCTTTQQQHTIIPLSNPHREEKKTLPQHFLIFSNCKNRALSIVYFFQRDRLCTLNWKRDARYPGNKPPDTLSEVTLHLAVFSSQQYEKIDQTDIRIDVTSVGSIFTAALCTWFA